MNTPNQKLGIISTSLAGVAFLSFIVFIAVIIGKGPDGLARLILGISFLAPIVGLLFGISGLAKSTASKTVPITGVVLNAVWLIGIALFCSAFNQW